MTGFLGQFPATAAALGGLGDSLGRFQTMITAFDSQLDNYNTIKDTSLYPIALVVLIGGLMVIGSVECGASWRAERTTTSSSNDHKRDLAKP